MAYQFVRDIRRVCKPKLDVDCASVLIDSSNFVADFFPSQKSDGEGLISDLDGQLPSYPISSRKFQGRFPITRHLLYY